MHQHRGILQVVVLVLASCGGDVAERDEARPAPPDTDWIVAHDLPPDGPGPIRAQRFHDGSLVSVGLAARSYGGSWSPDGRYYVYNEAGDRETAGPLLARTVDDLGWSEPVSLDAPSTTPAAVSPVSFSPTGDAFVQSRFSGRETISMSVYTELESGGFASHDLRASGDHPPRAWWSADGMALVTQLGTRVVAHTRSGTTWSDVELAPPPELELDGAGFGVAGDSLVSSDGRFVVVTLRQRAPNVLEQARMEYLYPLAGGTPRPIEGCAYSSTSTRHCRAYGWIGASPSLLLLHLFVGGRDRVDQIAVYDVDQRTTTILGNLFPDGWLNEGRWLLARQEQTSVLVDFTDARTPRIVPLADRSRVSASPDGRWAFVGSSSQRVFDLSAPPPWLGQPTPPQVDARAYFAPDGVHAWTSDVVKGSVHVQRANLQTLEVDSFDIPHGPVPSTWLWKLAGRFSPDHTHMLVPRDGALAVWTLGTPLDTAWPLTGTPEWSAPRWRHSP